MKSSTVSQDDGGGNNHFSSPPLPKTFAAFLQTDTARTMMVGDFHSRIANAGTGIKTLTGLKNFARERYPEQYRGWRDNTSDQPCGKEVMTRVWSAFLRWSEAK